jgi:hypothetical protein
MAAERLNDRIVGSGKDVERWAHPALMFPTNLGPE